MTDSVYQYLMQMYGGGGADPFSEPTPIPGVDDPLNLPHEGMGVPQSAFDPMNISPNETMFPPDLGYFPPDYPPDFNSSWFGNNYSGSLSFDDLFNMPWDNAGGGGGGYPTPPGVPPDVLPALPYEHPGIHTSDLVHALAQDRADQGLGHQLGLPTDWRNAGKLITGAAGNIANAAGAFGNNIMNDPRNTDPAYLRTMGYEPGQGKNIQYPGGATGPSLGAYDVGGYGVGGEGGSFFHGGASVGAGAAPPGQYQYPHHGATSVAGATYGLGGASPTDISMFLRNRGLGTNLRGRMIKGQYMPANFHPFSSVPGVSAAQFMAARNAGAGALPQNPQGLRPPGFAIGQNPSNIPGGGRPFTLPT